MLSDRELDEIEARANAASPGPWAPSWTGHVDGPLNVGTVTPSGFRRGEDARFIAFARTDVPRLVAEVRRLRALVQAFGDYTAGEVPDRS